MYKFDKNHQFGLADFNQPMGLKMNPENRWVKKAEKIPWEAIEEKYAALFPGKKGMPAKPLRTALGSLLIQKQLQFSDRELVEEIRENPYFQYFIGLPGYQDTIPFVPSLLVEFRKRLTAEVLEEIDLCDDLSKQLATIRTLVEQQQYMYENKVHSVPDRIVSISQPFVIATARPLRAAKKFLESVETDAGIYHNGALIYKLGEKMDGFQIDSVKKLVDQVLNKYPKASIAVESDDVLYSNFNVEHLWPGTDYIITAADFAELEGKKADKVIIEVSSMEDMERYKEFLSDDLYIQLSENKIGMIMKKNATKSNGIIFLAQSYGINIDDVICFGDDYNDIDMLTLCGTGICMANGVQKAKDAADVLCDTNENDGVAKWIKENILSNQQ